MSAVEGVEVEGVERRLPAECFGENMVGFGRPNVWLVSGVLEVRGASCVSLVENGRQTSRTPQINRTVGPLADIGSSQAPAANNDDKEREVKTCTHHRRLRP